MFEKKKEGDQLQDRRRDNPDIYEHNHTVSSTEYNELAALLDLLTKPRSLKVPLSMFCKELTTLETVTKYLKEHLDLSFTEIGTALGRSRKVVWTAYRQSREKFDNALTIEDSLMVPVRIFNNDKLSMAECLVSYLKDTHHFTYVQIAQILERDQRTIWTVYKRSQKKHGHN